MKTMLAVDGNNILNRAYYGIRPMSTTDGIPTNAVYGVITMLSRQVEDYSPDMCAIAFDLPVPTFRHRMYDAYKGTRKPMDNALSSQLPYIKEAVAALGFTILESEGFEADDILGTLASKGKLENYKTLLMTGDRDCFQLIDDYTYVIYPGKSEYILLTPDSFQEKYGIKPEQVIDLKALMGDSSDNIPGVPGIGEKSAVALLQKFGTLDNIYQSLPSDIKPGLLTKLETGKKSAYLSKTLATIIRDVPGLPVTESMTYRGIKESAARDLFCKLEFSQLLRRFNLDSKVGEEAMDNVFPKEEENSELFDSLIKKDCSISIDGGFIFVSDGLFCAKSAYNADNMKSVSINAEHISCWDCKTIYELSDAVGVRLRNIGFDCMLASYVVDPQIGSEINKAVTAYLGQVRDTSVSDAVYSSLMKPVLLEKMRENSVENVFSEIEMPLAAVLADMEEEGFLIDREGLAEYGRKLSRDSKQLQLSIFNEAGEEFNINSPKQLGNILFEKLGLPSGKKNSNGYSTSAEILERLAPTHSIVRNILEYRKLCKLNSTYVVGLLKVADENGRVHTSFRQTGTVTGRLSSAEPNLQNIPVRTEEGRELRRFFLPSPGHILIDADYSQIELRILACISGDENMIRAFNSGADIHRSTAAAVFGISEDQVTPELRKRAKAVNFGIVYGIGEYSLSQDIGSTVKEAKAYIDNYLAGYPGVAEYLKEVVQRAKRDGYTETLFGRRRYIPELNASNSIQRKFGERVAMNSPIQGSAADIIKIAMINVYRRLREEKLDARLILQVHDELMIDSSVEESEKVSSILREEMENAVVLPVKLTVDLKMGRRWLD